MKINLEICNKSPNPFPSYATEGDSGFDIRAWIKKEESELVKPTIFGTSDECETINLPEPTIFIQPGSRRTIHTGLYLKIPKGYELQVRPRSGLSSKHGIHVHLGTIDQNYRGEICVILFNHGNGVFAIVNGDRIAQGVLCPVAGEYFTNLVSIDEIDTNTQRGAGGFGHTGTL